MVDPVLPCRVGTATALRGLAKEPLAGQEPDEHGDVRPAEPDECQLEPIPTTL